MTQRLIRAAGASASVCAAALAQGQKSPELLGNAVEATPVRIAPAVSNGSGFYLVGDWIDYDGGLGRSSVVFDCYGDADSDGVPDGAGACGLGSSRWFFGTGYCTGLTTNDMTLDWQVDLLRVDLAWYWSCLAPQGGGEVEDCEVLVLTQDSIPCEGDSFDYSGWLIDFGSLSCNSGAYYYANVDISGDGRAWPYPPSGVGSYIMAFLTSDGATLATCAQPMLWGTGDARGDPNASGTQGPNQLDDDSPLDGFHSVTTECYTYSFGVCPDPLGAMAQFWGDLQCCGCDYADCDANNGIDTRDFTCYLNRWAANEPSADCDSNGVVDTRDFTCFLDIWVTCR